MDIWVSSKTLPHLKSHFPSFREAQKLPFNSNSAMTHGLQSSSGGVKVAEWVRMGGQSYYKYFFGPFQGNIRIRNLGMISGLLFSCLFDFWNVYYSFFINCFHIYWNKGLSYLCCSSLHPCINPHTWTKQRKCMALWDVYDKCLVIVLYVINYCVCMGLFKTLVF